jgi:hydrogenase 3 maturation protease
MNLEGMAGPAGLDTELRLRLKGHVLLIGAGNMFRGDDGAGPAVIGLLEGKTGAALLDVGEMPHNHITRILEVHADTMVFIDAANFGAPPGAVALLEVEDIAGCSTSTHQMPMDVFFRYIKQNGQAEIFALGIQPAQIGFGEPMSPAVEDSVKALADLLRGLLPPAGDMTGA